MVGEGSRKVDLLEVAPGTGRYLGALGRLSLVFGNKIALALTLLLLVMIVGTSGFMVFMLHRDHIMRERLEVLESAGPESAVAAAELSAEVAENTFPSQLLLSVYMTAISITTVGYGDAVREFTYDYFEPPWQRAYNIWLSIYLIIAYLIILYVNANFVAYLVESKLTENLQRRGTVRRIGRLSGHMIVCGCGATGNVVIKELIRTGAPVVGVDLEKKNPTRLKRKKGFTFLSGDALDERVLVDAGVRRARGLVSVLPDASSNLYLTLTAALANGDLRIVSRSVDLGSNDKLAFVGASDTVTPAVAAGRRMVAEMTAGETTGFLQEMVEDTGESYRVEECRVAPGCGAVGRTLGELRIGSRTGVAVFAVLTAEGETIFNPSGDRVLREGDVLLGLASPSRILKVARIIWSGRTHRWWAFWRGRSRPNKEDAE
jgi:voltage-gated potassium channel